MNSNKKNISTYFTNYIENRRLFYKNLYLKLPFGVFKANFATAVIEYANTPEIAHSLHINFNESIGLKELEEYCLTDFIKKADQGTGYAQLVISVEEACFRAQNIETTGLVFMQLLTEHNPKQGKELIDCHETNKRTLVNLKKLEDDLKYGRLCLL